MSEWLSPERHARGLRIAAAASPAEAPVPLTPVQEALKACELLALSAQKRRADLIPVIAREALNIPGLVPIIQSLWRDLAQMEATPSVEPWEPETLWMLRRPNGSLITLLRLRANGLAGQGNGKQDVRWRRDGDSLWLGPVGDQPASRFTVFGRSGGHGVMLGVTEHQTPELRVLTQVDCMYTQLRMIDPELTNPMAGLFRPEQMMEPVLPAVPVVVLAAPRTGSHLLINLLNSSGRVFIDAEILNAAKISVFGGDLPADRKDGLDMLRISDPVRFAKVMMTRSHHTDGRQLDDIGVRGFKLFPEHARQVYDWAIETPQVRIIHLHRENLLAEFSSYLAAHRDGRWIGDGQQNAERKVLFDSERFTRFFQMKSQYLGQLRERLARREGLSIEIEYSQISRTSVLQVLSFLLDEPQVDVPLDALGLRQQLSASILDRFHNPEEVVSCLKTLGHSEWALPERDEVSQL
jgi:LPS sulfotransferase NodH